jgi:hypothetical protein
VISDDGGVGFRVGAYDRDRTLVIDPILSYATLFWGRAMDVAVDVAGNAYVAGYTSGTDLPASGGYQTKLLGSLDAYVVKLDPSGRNVLYATYLGARKATTMAKGIAVDGSGNAYLVGSTDSKSFPTTTGAYQRTFANGASFVAKLNPAGNALVYSTFVNGAALEDIAVDPGENAYLTGKTGGEAPFATTEGTFQTTPGGSVVAKLNAAGSAMAYASYFGAAGVSVRRISIDASGHAYLTGTTWSGSLPVRNALQGSGRGQDAFVSKLSPDGRELVFSTYLGGSDREEGGDIAVDGSGDVYVVGTTWSDDFPMTFAAFQPRKAHPGKEISNAFIAKLTSSGNALAYSSYLGGRWCFTTGVHTCFGDSSSPVDSATAVAVDGAGFAYVGGFTRSAEFPLLDQIHGVRDGTEDSSAPFVTKVRPAGDALIYSLTIGFRDPYKYLGGLALDPAGAVYAVGGGFFPHDPFPFTAGMPLVANNGSFVAKLGTGRYPTTLRSSPNPALAGQAVTFTATVNSPLPGGTVRFTNGSALLGEATVSNGTAVLSTVLPPGAHEVKAAYSVDGVVSPPVYQVTRNP